MTCTCGKNLHERTVATKTKEINGHVVVLASKPALCCDEHGVVAWGALPKFNQPFHQPYVFPYRPWLQPTTPGTALLGNPLRYTICATSGRGATAGRASDA